MLLGPPGEAAELGPSGVPEEEHAAFDQHVGYPDQVPLPSVTGLEGILDLLSFARFRVQHEFLGVVSSVALLCHENLPFRGFVEVCSISSLSDAGQPYALRHRATRLFFARPRCRPSASSRLRSHSGILQE
jgi:hypothetical protein